MVGDFTAFANYKNAPSVLYDMVYYDINKKFIKKESAHGQFFPYYRPKNAKYCKIVFHEDVLPTDGKEEYNKGYCVKIGHVKRPYRCTLKNNVIHNASFAGIAFVVSKDV